MAPAELTSEVALGDLTTMDPCSLTDPEVFDELGSAGFTTPESLDYCTISLDTSDGGEVYVYIGSLGVESAIPDLDDNRVRDLDSGMWIGQQEDDSAFCAQLLVFPDGVTMQVAASVYKGSPETCPMVEAGMDKAVEVILAEGVEHRDPDADSLLSIDPCDLIDDDDITKLPLFEDATQPGEYPGRHTCYWELPDDFDTSIRVEFSAGPEPSAYKDGANENPIAGRPSATNPYPDFGAISFCAAETGHLPFEEVAGQDDMVEIAAVYVRVPTGQVNAGCQAAVAVAQVVWPELPSVS